jgi:hypothetical protein
MRCRIFPRRRLLNVLPEPFFTTTRSLNLTTTGRNGVFLLPIFYPVKRHRNLGILH